MPARSIQDAAPIYQLKITLRGICPPIWRRVLTPGSVSLHKVHRIIQVVMGWMDCHRPGPHRELQEHGDHHDQQSVDRFVKCVRFIRFGT